MPLDDPAVANMESRLLKLERRGLYDAIAGLLLSLAVAGHLLFGSCPGGGIFARSAPNDKAETVATPNANIPNVAQAHKNRMKFRIMVTVIAIPVESERTADR